MSLLNAMRKVDPDTITQEQMELIQPYLSAEDFTVERVRVFGAGLCVPIMKWVLCVSDYVRRKTQCAPILTNYFLMQEKFRTLSATVARASDALAETRGQTDVLRKQYDDAVARKQSQETADDRKQTNIKNAEELLAGLKHQQLRWTAVMRDYNIELHRLAGACTIAAAFLTYCGPLDSKYKERAVDLVLTSSCRDNGMKLKVMCVCVCMFLYTVYKERAVDV
jgi:dynein heavy chain